jgi:transcriptional regulator with XRE-family HTH domain
MKADHPDKELNLKNIADKLESMGLSQLKLASQLGVSRQAVSKWMKNEKFPRPEKLLCPICPLIIFHDLLP